MLPLHISPELGYVISLTRMPDNFVGCISDYAQAIDPKRPYRARTFLKVCVSDGVLVSKMWKLPFQELTVTDTYRLDKDRLEDCIFEHEFCEQFFDLIFQRLGVWQTLRLFWEFM